MRREIGKSVVSLKGLIYGKEGTRKSNTAIQIAKLKKADGTPMRVLLLDLEYKAIEGYNEQYLMDSGVDVGNVLEERTRDINKIEELIHYFVKGQPIPKYDENDKKVNGEFEKDGNGADFIADAIVLDSVSVLQTMFVEGRTEVTDRRTRIKIKKEGLSGDEKELALENSGMQLLDWSKLRAKALKLVRDLQSISGKHVFYICRAKDATVTKLVDGKMVIEDLGYEEMDATSFRKDLPYEVSLVLHNKRNKDGECEIIVKKDSTGVTNANDVFDNFDLTMYEDYINNKSKTTVVKTKSYEEDLKKATIYTEDSEEGDNKTKLYGLIVNQAKNNPEINTIVKEYCKKHNVSFKNIETVSEETLMIIKELIQDKI